MDYLEGGDWRVYEGLVIFWVNIWLSKTSSVIMKQSY